MRADRLVLALALSIIACKGTSKATERVAASLRDPSSAQFRNVKRGTDRFVCGEVNAKNAYGGYVGFVPFMVSDTGPVVIHSEEHRIMRSRWTLECWPDSVRSTAHRDSLRRALLVEDSMTVKLAKAREELKALNESIDALRNR